MTTIDLAQVNRERLRKGLPPLHREQAYAAMQSRKPDDAPGFDTTGFLIGYMTGIPMPSAGGIMGAMMHPTSHADASPSYSAPASDSFSGGGGSYGGGGASSSWSDNSSSSSSDSSSSSSSSSDSGSSSSGGGGD